MSVVIEIEKQANAKANSKVNMSAGLDVTGTAASKGRLADILAGLDRIAATSSNLVRVADPGEGGFPHYLFIGPKGGDQPIRVGIFAGIHGDEPEGVHALLRFIRILESKPELATGYCLFFYPVCNPSGFENGLRYAASGKDLNREFWKNSDEPEVRFLESELQRREFQGLISIHTDDTSDGFYGYAHGATLTEELIEPALKAADQFIPRNDNSVIDGFNAQQGIIRDAFDGILRAAPSANPKPFEIILETPQAPPAYLKEAAIIAALQTILIRYREFISYASNL